jgi:alkanesulfonate monooxygenase SsuD/methylene tetrahydromethanopterin reductase-like flavin-dependent oxidoreductase (luciferase family)
MTGSEPIRIGLSLPTWPRRDGTHATWPEMRTLARDAEALGVDTIWVPDHLQRRLPDRPVIGFWECWTILAAAAEATSRIGIGPLVACTGFRNPALLARMAETLDEVSGGRVVLGLGSGVPARDESWRAFGFPAERHVGRYAESVEVTARLLRERVLTFEGTHVRTDGAEMVPGGPRPGGVPVWVAAQGDRTAEIAARWGDAANVNTALCETADVAAIRATMARSCDAVGRDPDTLSVTGWSRLSLAPDGTAVERDGYLSGDPSEVGRRVRAFRDAGLDHLTLYVGAEDDPSPLPALTGETLTRFAPVLEAIRAA